MSFYKYTFGQAVAFCATVAIVAFIVGNAVAGTARGAEMYAGSSGVTSQSGSDLSALFYCISGAFALGTVLYALAWILEKRLEKRVTQ